MDAGAGHRLKTACNGLLVPGLLDSEPNDGRASGDLCWVLQVRESFSRFSAALSLVRRAVFVRAVSWVCRFGRIGRFRRAVPCFSSAPRPALSGLDERTGACKYAWRACPAIQGPRLFLRQHKAHSLRGIRMPAKRLYKRAGSCWCPLIDLI